MEGKPIQGFQVILTPRVEFSRALYVIRSALDRKCDRSSIGPNWIKLQRSVNGELAVPRDILVDSFRLPLRSLEVKTKPTAEVAILLDLCCYLGSAEARVAAIGLRSLR